MSKINSFWKWFLIMCLLLLSRFGFAHDIDLSPKIRFASIQGECDDALALATTMYQAKSSFFYAPTVIPVSMNSEFILGNQVVDISGGHGIVFSSDFFTPYPQMETPHRDIFWGNASLQGYRLVIEESSYGWRGDTYSLYLLKESISPEEFLLGLSTNYKMNLWHPVVFDHTWRAPLVFQYKASGRIWILDVNPTLDIDIIKPLSWDVYIPIEDRLERICSIDFPQLNAEEHDDLRALIRFSSLLMQTHGDGRNEGTLQATARLQRAAKRHLYNALFRPWSLWEPYNTRAEIDEGLKVWAEEGPLARALYQKIQQQYPKAQRVLERFYQKHYGLSLEQAQNYAIYALDILYREHFTFHSERDLWQETYEFNPWLFGERKLD